MHIGDFKVIDKYSLGELKVAVKKLTGNFEELSVTPTTSEQVFKPSASKDGFIKVTVGAVNPSDYQKEEEEARVTPTKEIQEVLPSGENKALSKVTVEAIPSEYVKPSGTIEIESNGEHNVAEYEKAIVSVGGTDMLQARVDNGGLEYLFYRYSGTTVDFIKKLKVTGQHDLYYMFYSCENVENIDLSTLVFQPISMSGTFYGCGNCVSIDISGLDTRNLKDISNIFYNCAKLTDVIGVLDLRNLTNASSPFYGCKALQNITFKNIHYNLTIGVSSNYCTKLTLDTLINIIQELWDLTGEATKSLRLSTASKNLVANTYVKLIDITDEMRAEDEYIDKKKPFVVCESTDEGAMLITEYAVSKNWTIA